MKTDEVYEAGRKRIAEMRRAQADRRAEVAKALRLSESRRERLVKAYTLLFSLLVAGYLDEAATAKVQAFLTLEDQ